MKDYNIETTNLFYVSNFNVIGGVETFIYELARKYHDKDITIVYKTGNHRQIERIAKFVRIIKFDGQQIKAKKAFFNYETDIIDNIDADDYTQIIHAMFKTNRITPKINNKINHFFAVSDIAASEFYELTGIKPKVVRNPLQITEDEKKPVMILVSATRLTQEKGKDRMEKLANLLTQNGIDFMWLVFTNDTEAINNPNIVYVKPRLNVRQYLNELKKCSNVYGVQLSDCEGDCYFTRECEALGIPLLATPIESFKEQKLVDGVNCYYLPFDMQDIDIDKIVNNKLSYVGYIRDDNWDKELIDVKSDYKEVNMKVKLKCVRSYFDIETETTRNLNEEFIVSRERADTLLNNPNNIVEFVEYIETPKKEKAVKPRKKVEKR